MLFLFIIIIIKYIYILFNIYIAVDPFAQGYHCTPLFTIFNINEI